MTIKGWIVLRNGKPADNPLIIYAQKSEALNRFGGKAWCKLYGYEAVPVSVSEAIIC